MSDGFYTRRREMTVRREVRGMQVIEAYGEIDLAVISALDEALDEAILSLKEPTSGAEAVGKDGADIAPNPKVVLNLCPVDFLDSQGVRSLLGYRAALKELGGELFVAAEPGEVHNILEMKGVDELFHVFESLEEALQEAEK